MVPVNHYSKHGKQVTRIAFALRWNDIMLDGGGGVQYLAKQAHGHWIIRIVHSGDWCYFTCLCHTTKWFIQIMQYSMHSIQIH